MFVAFSNEFVFCNREYVNRDYTKIYGYNRIKAGDWVYFKGSPKPGFVKSIFQTPDKLILVVTYDGGPFQRIEKPRVTIEDEESPVAAKIVTKRPAMAVVQEIEWPPRLMNSGAFGVRRAMALVIPFT